MNYLVWGLIWLQIIFSKETCIFNAKHASDLKTNTYRKNCLANLNDNILPHWIPIELNHVIQWRNYTNTTQSDYELLQHSDCDHLLEAQVLMDYIRPFTKNTTNLCYQFDHPISRSIQIRDILNARSNMRFIDKSVNQSKGKLFGLVTGSYQDIIKKHQLNKYANLVLNYLDQVQKDIRNTSQAIQVIFNQFPLSDLPPFTEVAELRIQLARERLLEIIQS